MSMYTDLKSLLSIKQHNIDNMKEEEPERTDEEIENMIAEWEEKHGNETSHYMERFTRVWQDGKEKRRTVSEMSDGHVANVITFFKRKLKEAETPSGLYAATCLSWICTMRKELELRKRTGVRVPEYDDLSDDLFL